MLGALACGLIGFVREVLPERTMDFALFVEHSRFTGDSVLTLAVADCVPTGSSYVDTFHEYTRAYATRCTWRSRAPAGPSGTACRARSSPTAL